MKTPHLPSNLRFCRRGHLHGFMVVALTALLGTVIASAQTTPSASHPATPVAGVQRQAATIPVQHGEEGESEAKPNTASQQGVKVHGHWKIDIRNRDGSLADTHEFENHLDDGGVFLSNVLVGAVVPGEAGVELGAPYGGVLCGSVTFCLLFESSTGWIATNSSNCTTDPTSCSANLTAVVGSQASISSVPTTPNVVVLSGSIVSSSNGTIGSVTTLFAFCSGKTGPPTVTPTQCASGTVPAGSTISATALTTADNLNIHVLSGQTIQVTVTLSFS